MRDSGDRAPKEAMGLMTSETGGLVIPSPLPSMLRLFNCSFLRDPSRLFLPCIQWRRICRLLPGLRFVNGSETTNSKAVAGVAMFRQAKNVNLQ